MADITPKELGTVDECCFTLICIGLNVVLRKTDVDTCVRRALGLSSNDNWVTRSVLSNVAITDNLLVLAVFRAPQK